MSLDPKLPQHTGASRISNKIFDTETSKDSRLKQLEKEARML